jgi:hypothetical protein
MASAPRPDSAPSEQDHSSTDAGGPGPSTVAGGELNAWRRGFTPQAEIWNGRLAMLGLSVGIALLLILRVVGGSHF